MYICTDQEQGKTTSRGLCTIIGSSHICFVFFISACTWTWVIGSLVEYRSLVESDTCTW